MNKRIWLMWVMRLFGFIVLSSTLSLSASEVLKEKEKNFKELLKRKTSFALNEVSGLLDTIPIAASLKKFFSTISFEDAELVIEGSDIEDVYDAFGIAGFVRINKLRVPAKLLFLEMEGAQINIILTIKLPVGWKFSNISPQLKPLDQGLHLTDPQFILSTFFYRDPSLHELEIQNGVNVLSKIKFIGPLAPVQMLTDNLDKIAIPESRGEIFLLGSLKSDITESSFTVFLPQQIDFDLKNAKPITKLELKKLFIEVSVSLNATLGLALTMHSVDVSQPINLAVEGTVGVAKAKIEGSLDTMLDPAFGIKWLALGDFGIEVDLNYALLSTTGLPSGFGIRGKMNLGTGSDATKLDVAGKVELGTITGASLMFSGKTNRLSLFSAIELTSKMIGKKVPMNKVPNVVLSDVEVTVVPEDIELAGKWYDQGVIVKGAVELFNVAGSLELTLKSENQQLIGKGFLKNIDTPVFKFTGPGFDRQIGTADDGPVLDVDISLRSQRFYGSGRMEIPGIQLVRDVEIEFEPTGATFHLEDKIFGKYTSKVDGRINILNPLDFYAKIELQQDFKAMIQKNLIQQFQVMREQAKKKIDSLDEQINQLKKSITNSSDKEVKKTESKINTLKDEINALQHECNTASWPKKAFICSKTSAQITEKSTELAALETYKEGLIKPGTAVVVSAIGGTQQIAELTRLKKAAQKTVDVTTKTLEYAGRGLAGALSVKSIYGELGRQQSANNMIIALNLVINVQGKDRSFTFNFDFGNLQASILELAIQLLEMLPE